MRAQIHIQHTKYLSGDLGMYIWRTASEYIVLPSSQKAL